MIQLYNVDCMKAIQGMNDDEFDLAIVDPPYAGFRSKLKNIPRYKNKKYAGKNLHLYEEKNWNNQAPSKEYFQHLRRVCKNIIVWGGNYFTELWTVHNRGFIVWDKLNYSIKHADCEFAYTSFDRNAQVFKYRQMGALLGDGLAPPRIHLTQKPVALYEWLLQNYAEEGDRILDTHLGSGSIAIACHNLGFDLVAYEIDEDYYYRASERLAKHQRQLKIDWGER